MGIICIALKPHLQFQFEMKLTDLDIKSVVKCEFDNDDVPFIKSGADSTPR